MNVLFGIAVAVIAAFSGLAGGYLTAEATRNLEREKFESLLRKAAAERRLAAAQRFTVTTYAWFTWLDKMAIDITDGIHDVPKDLLQRNADELDSRGRERTQAYRELQLLAGLRYLTG